MGEWEWWEANGRRPRQKQQHPSQRRPSNRTLRSQCRCRRFPSASAATAVTACWATLTTVGPRPSKASSSTLAARDTTKPAFAPHCLLRLFSSFLYYSFFGFSLSLWYFPWPLYSGALCSLLKRLTSIRTLKHLETGISVFFKTTFFFPGRYTELYKSRNSWSGLIGRAED